jgi:hypothetical protein
MTLGRNASFPLAPILRSTDVTDRKLLMHAQGLSRTQSGQSTAEYDRIRTSNQIALALIKADFCNGMIVK